MDLEGFGLDEEEQVTLKLKTSREVLLDLVTKTGVVVPSKDVIPVLANYRVQATATALRITTTNLEISMVCATKEVTVEAPGEAFFPVRRFAEILNLCPKHSGVMITVRGQQATIVCSTTVWTLMLHSGIGYPALPEVQELTMTAVPRESLLSCLASTKYAASTNPAKPSLMMICFTGDSLIATDGIRLHTVPLISPALSLPIQAVDDVLMLCRRATTENVMMGEARNHIVFQAGTDVLVINKTVAEWPDITPFTGPAQRHKEYMVIDRDALIEKIRQVKTSADLESPTLTLELVRNELRLRTADRYGNKGYAALDVERPASGTVFGSTIKCALMFHNRQLLETLGSFDCKSVRLYFGGDSKTKKFPVLIRDEESGSFAILAQMLS